MASRFPSRPTLLAFCCSATFMTQAAEPLELEATDVNAETFRRTPSTPLEAFAGG
ncbi:hypothetical protein [Pseudomonas alabamensis]